MLTITISYEAEVILREFRRMKKTMENREKKLREGDDGKKKMKYVRKENTKLISTQESWSDVIVWMGRTLKDHGHTRPKDGA